MLEQLDSVPTYVSFLLGPDFSEVSSELPNTSQRTDRSRS